MWWVPVGKKGHLEGKNPGVVEQAHIPNATTVLLLSGCPHGCRSLLGDNPQLLLITLQVKTLCPSACGTGPPCLADLKSFRCSWSPCSKPPFLLITESLKRFCFSWSSGYIHYVSTNSLERLIFPLPLPHLWCATIPGSAAGTECWLLPGRLVKPRVCVLSGCYFVQQYNSRAPAPPTPPGLGLLRRSIPDTWLLMRWPAEPGVSSRDDCKS